MKSHVSLEQHQCPICGEVHDTGTVLLDRRLRDSMERHTVTGWGLCDECDTLHKDGYIALISCDPAASTIRNNRVHDMSDAYRTGEVVHLKRERWGDIFRTPVPANKEGDPIPFVFCDQDVIAMLRGAVA